MPGVRLIGVAGPSGSGKTAVADLLAARLGGTHISLDHYYRDLGHLPFQERARVNFDDPASLDWELAERQVAALARGEAIEQPQYDLVSHARKPEPAHVEPAPAVIIDGIFALWHEGVRRQYALGVFVDLGDDVCLARRLERDMRERGRSRESVLLQYEQTVRPMSELYVRPTRELADVVVRGDWPLEESARRILERLGSCDHARPTSP